MQLKIAFGNTKRKAPRIRGLRTLSRWGLLPCLALLGSLGLPARASADTSLLASSALSLYGDPQAEQGAPADANAGPVRLARFAMLTGDVTWRDSADGSWSQASPNMPLRQGAQIWVSEGGRAEVQFDDGSRIRLDSNTLITLQTLYSDADGEFTEITLNDGQVYLRLNNKFSLYQVNTPLASLKAAGPAQVRVGGGEGAQFGVRSGAATIEGAAGKASLNAGDYLDVVDANAAYNIVGLPRPDRWDTWNLNRDEALDNGGRNGARHLPANVALVADDLDQYGSWHDDRQYGWVWVPRNVEPDWRPYRAGHWTWVEPFGWTWVSTESWGWAPYHYGAWVHQPYGWGWVPGPTTQYWSPGVVSFTENAGVVAWCPLAPAEVHYPSRLALGFRSGNWSMFFSIGGAAVYYPANERYCEPRPFRNTYVNQVTYVNRVTNVTNVTNVYNVNNITVNHNTYLTNARFVPSNARWQGGTQVQTQAFGGRATYQPSPGGAQSVFARGQVIAGPAVGRPVAGPQSVRVTAQSLTPTRTYQAPTQLPQKYVSRPVYRAPLPSNVPHIQSLPQTGQRFTTHPTIGSVPVNPGTATGRTPVTGPGRANEGVVGTRPTGPGRTTEGTGSRPTGPGRPTEGAGSRPTTAGGNPPKPANSGSSGLDAYLRERAARNGGSTGSSGGGTASRPPTSGTRDNNTTRTGTDTPPNIPGRPRVNGDNTLPKIDSTRRNADGTPPPRADTTRRNGDSTQSPRVDTTRRNGDTTPPKIDSTRRQGDNPGTPRTDPTPGAGSRTPGQPRSTSDTYRPLHSGQPTGGKGDTGKSGRSTSDPKSTDKSKDNPLKDHKNP